MKFRVLAALAIPFVLPAISIAQDYTPWVFQRIESKTNEPICVLSAARKGDDRVQNVALKIFSTKGTMHITAYLDTWNFAGGTDVPATVDFMDNRPINVVGYGDGKIVDINLQGDASFETLGGFLHAQFLQLGFPNSSYPTWTVPLPKNRQAIKKLVDCSQRK